LAEIVRAVRDAPDAANVIPPVMSSQTAELKEAIRSIAAKQEEEMRLVSRNIGGARRIHAVVDAELRRAARRWRYDSVVLNLCGYHRKNAYTLKHWGAIQGGRAPKDPLLRRAEQWFFQTLFVNPNDYSGLDGLSSILIYERELEAAEFFCIRAIELAARAGIDYTAAKENLALIRRFKPPDAPATVKGIQSGEASLHRGVGLLYQGRVDEAIEELLRATTLRPDYVEAYSTLAAALIGSGRVREGLDFIEQVLLLRPEYPEALYNGACGWALSGDTDKAMEWLERAIRGEPRYRETARSDPHLAALRERPRFQALAASNRS
jgi:tetratricopeptide (TPR) repeat protein